MRVSVYVCMYAKTYVSCMYAVQFVYRYICLYGTVSVMSYREDRVAEDPEPQQRQQRLALQRSVKILQLAAKHLYLPIHLLPPFPPPRRWLTCGQVISPLSGVTAVAKCWDQVFSL